MRCPLTTWLDYKGFRVLAVASLPINPQEGMSLGFDEEGQLHQLDYAMRKKKVQIDQSIKQKMSDVFNNSSLANHYFLTKVINMKQRELE